MNAEKRIILWMLIFGMLFAMAGCGKREKTDSEESLIEQMVVYYGRYGDDAREKNAELLARLRSLNPDSAERWESILALWESVSRGVEIHPGILPGGLPDTEELCMVVLGFQLKPDGSMRDELVERLNVALACAEKYPDALIVCTGGGTAAENRSATEAGKMAEYLIAHGIDPEQIIVEDRSQTTAQNAVFTLEILAEKYPQVRQIAIISSDYHIATGVLLFGAQSILSAEKAGSERFTVVSNAAYPAPSGSLSAMFQAGALIELSGDTETAYDIYFDTYDIHELPPPENMK